VIFFFSFTTACQLQPPPSKNFDTPKDVDSGLPIGQHHHEAWRKFLRDQRNMEYNQHVDVVIAKHCIAISPTDLCFLLVPFLQWSYACSSHSVEMSH